MAAPDPAAHFTESVFDVRCPSGDLHFKVIDDDRIEVKCGNRHCRIDDCVVLHRYSRHDFRLLETLKFTDPVPRGRGARTFRKEAP